MQYHLLIMLFFCHFLADFTPLSTPWMLKAKQFGNPLLPILCHAWVHALLLWIILYIWIDGNLSQLDLIYKLSIFELTTHFLIDIRKGKMSYLFPSLRDTDSSWYRILFGLDQYLHAIVIIMIVYWYGISS